MLSGLTLSRPRAWGVRVVEVFSILFSVIPLSTPVLMMLLSWILIFPRQNYLYLPLTTNSSCVGPGRVALIGGLSNLAPSVPEHEAYRSLETVNADYSWDLVRFFLCNGEHSGWWGSYPGSRNFFHFVPSYR